MQYGTSLVVQRLRHHSSTARGTGSILDQGNKILSSMAKKLKKKKSGYSSESREEWKLLFAKWIRDKLLWRLYHLSRDLKSEGDWLGMREGCLLQTVSKSGTFKLFLSFYVAMKVVKGRMKIHWRGCCLVAVMSDSLSSPGASVHGVAHERLLEWVAVSFSRGSLQTRIKASSPGLADGFFTSEPPGKPTLKRTVGK